MKALPINDYTNFNFDYHVPNWEQTFVQVFGDQHAKNSHTYLVHKQHDANTSWQFHEDCVTRTGTVPIYHATNLQPEETDGIRMFSNFFNWWLDILKNFSISGVYENKSKNSFDRYLYAVDTNRSDNDQRWD